MKHENIGKVWDKNAPSWCEGSHAGYDLVRNLINTPTFLELLPDITESTGLDVGCGDGYNTRLIAKQCKKLTSIDLSKKFLEYSEARAKQENINNLDFQ